MLHPQEELWALLFYLLRHTSFFVFYGNKSFVSPLLYNSEFPKKTRIMDPPWPSNVHIGYNVVVITNSLEDDWLLALSIRIIAMSWLWSIYWYVCTVHCSCTIRKSPSIIKTINDMLQIIICREFHIQAYLSKIFSAIAVQTSWMHLCTVDFPTPNRLAIVWYSAEEAIQ